MQENALLKLEFTMVIMSYNKEKQFGEWRESTIFGF
mgnify:CR=1 FL=1